jgi:Tol biopolymer transport system component
LAWAPSGKEVWFSAADAGEQYCIHAVTLAGKQRTVHCGTSPTRIQDIAPSGAALVSTEEHRVSIALVEHGSGEHGSSEERDLSWLDNAYGPRISHDGSEILFTDQSGQAGHDYSVYVRKTDGSPAIRIGSGGFGTDLSADGKSAIIVLPKPCTGTASCLCGLIGIPTANIF